MRPRARRSEGENDRRQARYHRRVLPLHPSSREPSPSCEMETGPGGIATTGPESLTRDELPLCLNSMMLCQAMGIGCSDQSEQSCPPPFRRGLRWPGSKGGQAVVDTQRVQTYCFESSKIGAPELALKTRSGQSCSRYSCSHYRKSPIPMSCTARYPGLQAV
jgi:hypothetical protein